MTAKRTYAGEPEWPPTFPTRDDIERHLANARALRSAATAEMLAAAFRSLLHPLRTGRNLLISRRRRPSGAEHDRGAAIPAE